MSFGIDFGTTNSIISFYNGREITSFTDENTKLPHPSILWYQGLSSPVVGRKAKNKIRELGNTPGNHFIKSIKSYIEKDEKIEIFGQSFYAWQIAGHIFNFLKNDISERYQNVPDLEEAVVTVPLYFDGKQRQAIRKAAEEAGISVKSFIHEPFAAVVGYLLADPSQFEELKTKNENILVFDWGGGTLDITLVRLDSGCLYEIGNTGASGNSGDYFDNVFMQYVVSQFQTKYNIPTKGFRLNKGIESLLFYDVEIAKIELSNSDKASIEITDFYEANNNFYNLVQDLNRIDFESLISQDIDDAMNLVDQVLEKFRVNYSQVSQVLLIGGTSQIPLLKSSMYSVFGVSKVVEVANADTIISEGAAIISYNNWQPFLVNPICIQLCDDSQYTIFENGTILNPQTATKKVSMFCNDNTDGEGRLIITESLDPDSNRHQIKKIVNIPVSKELNKMYQERVFVDFTVDYNIILQINAKSSIKSIAVNSNINDLCYGLRFA